jgi:hypothetical protein
MPERTKLSSSYTVGAYRRMEAAKDIVGIVRLLEERLRERYINPIKKSNAKNGFAVIALGCLLLETLQCFYTGRATSDRQSRAVFKEFFARDPRFLQFHEVADDFYYGVRCGILHQGETSRGWTIVRYGPLVDLRLKRINASRFLRELSKSLKDYSGELRDSDWSDERWQKFRAKMNAIVYNCEK